MALAETIWDYMRMDHTVTQKCDVLLCLGSYDIRVAEKSASLWLQGFGDVIVFSGNTGKLTEGIWDKPEAEVFRDRAVELGVPAGKCLVENSSTNTGENVQLSYKILKERHLLPTSVLIVQKPYMERRAYATFLKQWPGDVSSITVYVTSPELNLANYPSETTGSLQDVISVMLGDMARIKLYEEKGFQVHQDIPENVQQAFDQLVATGKYLSHMPS
ncbi:uncharacterized protein SCO4629-like [Mya arenaria]|uniref:uncharacterized protein SCO4629-like n=1 Tax=Mya arenaria TaxID=6604 RepID=UPI0022E27DD8|nr:uncharacterized protein SCO4629-like [Mya arenaria]